MDTEMEELKVLFQSIPEPHAQKRTDASKDPNANKSQKHKVIYPIACQIKLLVDTPEQVQSPSWIKSL
jgi:hypothetical protein